MDSPATRRLFVALDLPDTVRHDLAAQAGELAGCNGGRAVRAENLHVTLAFLGGVPAALVPEVAAQLHAAGAHHSFATHVTRLVARPRPASARLIAAELDDPAGTMATLAGTVRRSLGGIDGVSVGDRPLWPHVTLVRFGRPTRVRRSPQTRSEHVFDFSRISLYDSMISPGASSSYEALCTVSLGTLA
jgi:2'-5' RNA ligase